jgi:hypothetical protein
MECPDCKGSGKAGLVHINRGDKPHEWRDDLACFRCHGKRVVPDEMADWMRRGKVARQDRLAKMQSLLERANDLNISPADVSAMELGRRDPAPLGV